MVLPLIPVAFMAVGALTGGSGLALGGKGVLDMKRATDRVSKSQRTYEIRRVQAEQHLDEVNTRLAGWGAEQEQALSAVVVRFAAFLERNAKQVRDSEKLLTDGLEVSDARVVGPEGIDRNAWSWVTGVVASAAVGGGVNVATTSAVASLGAASTGAAISGLSGAAAQSATLAWLGGGALSAGGGGVALGATVLNVVAIGPALLLGGFVAKGQGKKAMTRAIEKQAEVDVAIAELDATKTLLDSVEVRVDELRSVLSGLVDHALEALEVLESEPFVAAEHAERFQSALLLVKATKEVALAPVLDDEGNLSSEGSTLTVKYRKMAEGNV
jgi:hypothetical protein